MIIKHLSNIIKVSSSDLKPSNLFLQSPVIHSTKSASMTTAGFTNIGLIMLETLLSLMSATPVDNSDRIINEIIDCWLELRAIRNALEIEEDPVSLKKVENISAFDQLMANIYECETEMHNNDAFYQLLQQGEVDAAVLSFYNLDDESRQAVLQ